MSRPEIACDIEGIERRSQIIIRGREVAGGGLQPYVTEFEVNSLQDLTKLGDIAIGELIDCQLDIQLPSGQIMMLNVSQASEKSSGSLQVIQR